MSEISVSIVIPVYNAEKYIERCVRSVLNQDYKDIEVITVDDGSTDTSGQILDALSEEDTRLQVIHKKNEGVSIARNTAIAAAKGRYIQFLDADDWIPKESTRMLIRTMEESDADLVIGDFYRVVGERVARKGSIRSDEVLSLQEFAEMMMESPADYYYGVLWNKLYRADIIRENNLGMDESLNFCEDFIFNLEYLLHCQKIAPLLVPVYYYVKTEGSLVSQSMRIGKIVNAKITVFSYYNDFFKNVLDAEQYNKDRLAITTYLINAASDDYVFSFLPTAKKLGEEKVQVLYRPDVDNILNSSYYVNKMIEEYMNTLALKYDLDIREIKIISALKDAGYVNDEKEITDFTGFSGLYVSKAMLHLNFRNLIEFSMKDSRYAIQLSHNADDIVTDLDRIEKDILEKLFTDFTDEEKNTFMSLFARINANIKNSI